MKKWVLVIDSGVGGISTLAAIRKRLAFIDIIYFADDTFLPYGNKCAEELTMHLCDIISCFEDEIQAVVLACNTATAVAVDFLRKIFCFPIIGTEPAVALACKTDGPYAALVTPLTAVQNKFCRLVANKPVRVFSRPNLALKIDNYFVSGGRIADLGVDVDVCAEIAEVVSELGKQKINKIVLGCTHYVFLKCTKMLAGFELFDGNDGVARRTEMFVENVGDGKIKFLFGSGDKKKSQIALRLFDELMLLNSSTQTQAD